MFDKLTNLAVPPWVRIVIPVALVLLIAGIGFWFKGVLVSAQIARLEGQVVALEYAVEDRNETITALKAAAVETAAVLEANNIAKEEAEANLAEHLSKPPRTITRWRERVDDVPESIPTGQPCEVQVQHGIELLQRALAEREGQ